MTKSNVLVIVTFAVVFAAGVMVGQLGWGGARGTDKGTLAARLDLTPGQREAVRKIWLGQLNNSAVDPAKRWEDEEEKRDQKVRAILTADQLAQYDVIERAYRDAAASFRDEVIQSQRKALEDTKEQLNPQQQQRFQRLVEEEGVGRQASIGQHSPAVPVSDVRPSTTQSKDAQAR